MIARLRHVKLRLVDAVAIAAIAVLALKATSFFAAHPEPRPGQAAGLVVVPGSEPLPSFFRAIANARTNYVPPDVTMTGAVPEKNPEEKKPASAKDGSASKQAAAEPPQQLSPAERAILERLGERREEIQQKGRELEMRERLLENAERRIESRLNELKTQEEKASEGAGKKGDSEAATIRSLVTMYETMKPKEAARMFERLPHDVLVPVVTQMNPRKMAEVLAGMSPDAAEKLTVALATRARAAAVERPQAATAVLPATELPAIDPPQARPSR
jgi:flagellar motility protein MotE (MotC chaperone)